MLTMYTVPKPMDAPCEAFGDGHIAMIQRNALGSWIRLTPKPEIVVMGNETGVPEAAAEFGARHVRNIDFTDEVAPYAPRVSDVFGKGDRSATYDTRCYINTDIMLTDAFMRAVNEARAWAGSREFLMVGQRKDTRITMPWPFDGDVYTTSNFAGDVPSWVQQEGWQAFLKWYTDSQGTYHGPAGIDWFVHTPGLWHNRIPEGLGIGRGFWDNFLVSDVLNREIPVIDATLCVLTVHQGHSVPWMSGNWEHPAILENKRIALEHGWVAYISHATHKMIPRADGQFAIVENTQRQEKP